MIRIKRINISNFGPVKRFDKELSEIEVFYGDNESGKTAIVDGIIRVLNPQSISPFNKAERRFNGYISILMEINGRIFELSEDRRKKNLYEKLLPVLKKEPNLLRFMIVRGGDLTLFPDRDRKKWWDGVKSFMVDNPNISGIRKRILEKAGLTEQAQLKKVVKERKEGIERRIREIHELKRGIEGIWDKEKRLDRIIKELNGLRKEREELKRAEAYERYERFLEMFNRWRDKRSRLKEYGRYKQEYFDRWEEKERELQTLRMKEREVEARLNETERRYRELIEDLEREKGEIEEEEDLLNLMESKGVLNRIEEVLKRKKNVERIHSYLSIGFWPGLIGAIIGGVLFILKDFWPGFLAFIFGLLILFCRGWIEKKIKDLEGKQRMLEEEIPRALRAEIKGIHEIFSLREKRRDLIEYRKKGIERRKGEIQRISEELNLLEGEKKEIRDRIDSINEEINELRALTGLAELREQTGRSDPVLWEDLIKELEISKPERRPDPARLNRVEREMEERKAEKERIEGEIREAKEIRLKLLGLSSLREAYEEEERLRKELKDIEIKERSGRLAVEILDSISKDMDLLLEGVLKGDRDSISQYFKSFTGGRYKEVKIRGYELYGVNFRGEEIPASLLSSGTQDQLFLAFRIPFLKKLLGAPSCLILDDAFLTSDYERKRNLVSSMRGLVREGWQLLYFTMDRYTVKLFEDIFGIKTHKIS